MSSDGRVKEVINTDGTSTSKYLIVNDIMDERFGQLTVRSVVYEDRGIYTCEAVNEFGTALAQAILTVQGMQNKTLIITNMYLFE